MTEATPPEEWRPIPGYEGVYEVSNEGRVRSLNRVFIRADGQRQGWRGRVLSSTLVGRGYPSVMLLHGVRRPIHILVCTAFHGPRPSAVHQVAHGDGDPTNNRAGNLRWATPAENSADAVRHGTSPLVRGGHGEGNGNAHLTWETVEAMRTEWDSGSVTQAALAAKYGLGKSQVHNIVRRKAWRSRED